MDLPANNPAWVLVPLVKSCFIAVSISSNWVDKSMNSLAFATLLKITTPTLILAPVPSIWDFKSPSISSTWFSKSVLVDLSKTRTTSVTSCFSAEGKDKVTWDSKSSFNSVAVLDLETSHSSVDSSVSSDTSAAKAMPGRIENIRTTTNQSAITYFACFFCMFHSPIFLV